MHDKVFQEGLVGYFNGLCLSDNPYNELSEEAIDWEDGWLAAENLTKTAFN